MFLNLLFTFFNLLTGSTDGGTGTGTESGTGTSTGTDTGTGAGANAMPEWVSWVFMGVIVAAIVVWFIFSRKKQKKQQQEYAERINAIKPGNKVKTIGGICGIVVEVCPEDDTFVLETGTEASGKSYLKFDKQAIYQTDAVAPVKEPVAQEPSKAPVEAAEAAPAVEEAPAAVEEETPVAEAPVEEAPKKKAAKKSTKKSEKTE
ncbi:MAG: preprotein translocase subunit YajC [Clostridia bacterium]|nr:preprotein translocase subunit YajC [Clostridia bacterium]